MATRTERRQLDAYFTPTWATQELLKRVRITGAVLEPCVGDGAIAGVLGCYVPHVHTNDLDGNRLAGSHEDATDARWWASLPPVDWVVSNPPFGVAPKILPLALPRVRVGMAMLLRLSYLEPCEGRAGWLAENPPAQLIVLPRISFTGDGKTDSVTCAWMVWTTVVEGGAIQVVPDPADLPGALLDGAA